MIFRSPYPNIDILTDVSLPDFLFSHALKQPDKTAYIDAETGRSRTFGEVVEASRRVAAGLIERGFKQGEVCALYSPNDFDWPIAYYGILAAGGVVTLVNPLYTSGELERQLEDTGAVMVITTPALFDRVQDARSTARVGEIFVLGEAAGATPFAALLESTAKLPEIEIDPESIALLPTSSGTTGLPKGVLLSHRAIVANICQCLEIETWNPDDVILATLPLFHMAGLIAFPHVGFVTNNTCVLHSHFDLQHVCQSIQDHRVTATGFVPPILLMFVKDPSVKQFDLSSLRQVITGAAPVGKELAEQFQSRFKCEVREGCGMTEASPMTFLTPPGRAVLGSTGVLMPSTEARVVNVDSGDDLGPDQRGEIWIRGPQVMKGYLNRPDATAETLTDDGWLKTGDIGYVDENGYFYIVDRVKELIKYKAYQVAPAELEDVFKGHPDIADAAVVGVPDEAAGELPKAYVVRSSPITEDEIFGFVADRVAPYKKIRLVEFTDEIPKTASGKILRRALIEREREAAMAS